MKKIKLAVICKGEYDYIEEFVDYHLSLGFDQIIIGDNNDVNGEMYQQILHYYVKRNEVKIINLRGKKAIQKEFYNALIDIGDYEWCAFIDADEFLTFNEDSKYTNIKDFLNSNPNINAYKVNWQCYGDNDKITMEDEDVTVRFPEPKPRDFTFHYPFSENYHCKSILRNNVKGHFIANPHTVEYNDYYSPSGKALNTNSPFNEDIEWDVLYIRHYYTKTIDEWINKKHKKGYADLMTPKGSTYRVDDFFIYNEKTPEKIKFLKENGFDYE